MKIEKIIIGRILLITISILILIVPDLIINRDLNLFNFSLTIFYKVGLFFFLGLILLRLTKSYYWAYFIIGIPYLTSSCVESINVIILNSYITMDNIKGLYFTLGSEIGEFFGGFYLYFLLPLLIIIIYIFILIKFKSIPYSYEKQRYIIPSSIFALLISLFFSFFKMSATPVYISGKNLSNYVFKQYYLKQHPFSLYYRTYEFLYSTHKINKFKPEKEHFKFDVLNDQDSLKPKIVVLIIGERTRYSNWSINGYNRETSPNLKKIDNIISFNKNFSNANCTANSIPLIITQATPQSPDIAFRQKTIVSLFKEVGYETIWISSQANCFDFIENKNEMDRLYEIYNNHNHTDLDIISTFNSVVKTKSSKNRLIVINMLGGHGGIPDKFNLFKPNSSQKEYPVTFENAPVFINDYDNMILLQDYVLSEIIKSADKQSLSSVLLFTADHGCNLFDNGNVLFGYGSSNPTEKETHVPLFIWGSNKFVKNSYKFKNLIDHKNLLTTNNNVFYTLADLANIKYKLFIKNKSIADSSYYEPSSRFVFVNNGVMEFKK